MSFLRTLLLIALGWWFINKALNYYFGVGKKETKSTKKTKPPFSKRRMDVQDAEFEEVDESGSNS